MNKESYQKMKEFVLSLTQKEESLLELENKADINEGVWSEGADAVEAHIAIISRELLKEVEDLEKRDFILNNLK